MEQETSRIRSAIDDFYRAFANRHGMAELWAHGDVVITMHPAGGRENGWREVNDAFQAALSSELVNSKITLSEIAIQVVGECAWAVYWERAEMTWQGGELAMDARVTNIYQHSNGRWLMVHHHASIPDLSQLEQLHRYLTSSTATQNNYGTAGKNP